MQYENQFIQANDRNYRWESRDETVQQSFFADLNKDRQELRKLARDNIIE